MQSSMNCMVFKLCRRCPIVSTYTIHQYSTICPWFAPTSVVILICFWIWMNWIHLILNNFSIWVSTRSCIRKPEKYRTCCETENSGFNNFSPFLNQKFSSVNINNCINIYKERILHSKGNKKSNLYPNTFLNVFHY